MEDIQNNGSNSGSEKKQKKEQGKQEQGQKKKKRLTPKRGEARQDKILLTVIITEKQKLAEVTRLLKE